MLEFYVDIENNAGVKQGSGPLTSVSSWKYTARMDAAGDFSCTFAATDSVAEEVVIKRVLRAWANLDGVWTEVGAGIVDNIERRVQPDGTVIMTASGQDLLRELTYRSVKNLTLENNGAPITHSAAVSAVSAYAPSGWTINADSAPAWNSIYGRFNGESVLASLLQVSDKSRNHFTRSSGRIVQFASTFSDSGIRAIQAGPSDLVAETCAITNLSVRHESYDLLTRIYPRGSGNGDVQLTLRNTTRSAPSGYTLDTVNNYLEFNSGVSTYGLIESWLDYREIGPISNSDADLQAAADMLFDVTLRELQRRNEEAAASYYDVTLAQCSALLRPMQTMRLVYEDVDSGLDVDTDLNILEATWSVDVTGVQTTNVVVSNVDRWPQSDVDAIVASMTQGHVYQALPQLNANSYVTAYTKNLDRTSTQNNSAQFRFRFGDEVVQLQQVLFEFQLLPFESTVRAVGGSTSGSGAIPTGGPSVQDTGVGGNNETGSGGGGDTGSATPTIGSATPDIGNATPTIGSATPAIGNATPAIGSATPVIGSATPDIGSVTPAIGSATPAIGSATPDIGTVTLTTSSSSLSTSEVGLTTGSPSGGDTIASGRHEHSFGITLGAGSVLYPVGFGAAGTSGGLISTVSGSTFNYPVSQSGNHTHSIGNHTHTIAAHTHTIASHTHTIAAHNHTIAAHTHTIASHTHTIASHTHTIAAHDHTIAAHNHTIAAHDHTIAAHDHTIAAHTHTIASHNHTIASHTHTISAHTHSMSNHTHSLNNHTHDLSESITAIYGIFREVAGNTYGIADLEYRVNSLAWQNLNTATSLPGDWYELDLTSQLVSTSVIGRPNQANNVLEIRAKTAGKTVTVDAQLTVRNIIQAIAYA